MTKWLAILCAIFCTGCSRSIDDYLADLFKGAQTSLDHGDLARAARDSRRGQALSAYLRNARWDWSFRCVLAEVYSEQRNRPRAAALLTGELPKSLSGTLIAARVEMDRGDAQAGLGPEHFDRSAAHFVEAEKLCRDSAGFGCRGELQLRRARLAYYQDDAKLAESLAKESFDIAKKSGLPFLEIRATTFLGALLQHYRHWGQAISWLIPATDMATRLKIAPLISKNAGNLGWCYYQVGDLDAALSNLQRAEAVAGETGSRAERRQWLTDIGLVYEDKSDFATAAKYDAPALALARALADPAAIAECVHNSGQHAFDRRDFRSAAAFKQEEVALDRKLGDADGELYSRYLEGFLFETEGDHRSAERSFLKIVASSSGDLPIRWQAQTELAEIHAAMKRPDLAGADFQAAIGTFEAARQALTADEIKLTFRASLNEYYIRYVRFLMRQGMPFDALKAADMSRAQVLAERLGVRANPAFDLGTLQAMAKRLDAAILSYWLAPDASYLWVITAKDFAALTLPPGPDVERLVENHRAGVARSKAMEDTRLYSALIAPAAKYLRPGGRVIVIPDGKLFNINFETLAVPGAGGPHYWIEDAIVSTATTVALLASPAPRSPKGNILLIGNPVPPSPKFPALPFSADELHAIAARFPPTRRAVYEGDQATPSAYAAARPEQYSWIHFAAHGVASKESPLDSAIILSDDDDSYQLYAHEIADLPLSADLVTISSCFSSGARTFSGEGIVGIAWAFLRAGAHNVVASLWEANDYYTARLMDRMYERLVAGDDAARALRDAKLSLLHSSYVSRFPRYWGGFQLYTGY